MNCKEIVAWTEANIELGDRRRSRCLGELVWGLLCSGAVNFAAIGRAMIGAATSASKIKRVFNFCHNPLVDVSAVRAALVQQVASRAAWMLGKLGQVLVVALDWHTYDNGAIHGLRVSLMTGSRALPLLWYEFKADGLKKRMTRIELDAIRELQLLCPAGCKWLVLMDSGFRSPQLLALLKEVGFFVARTNTAINFHPGNGCWAKVGHLPVRIGQALECGWVHLGKENPLDLRLIAARLYNIKPPKPGRRSYPRRCKQTMPGFCAVITNLPVEECSTQAVLRLYGRRFEIEHSFRDIKNATLGLDMEHVHLVDTATYSRLMAVVAVTEMLLWVIGSEAEAIGLHRELTPSQPRDGRRVLSLVNVGRLCLFRIESPVEALLSKHLAETQQRLLVTIGRRWKDATEILQLVGTAPTAGELSPLGRHCADRAKKNHPPCISRKLTFRPMTKPLLLAA